jgi:hypothetical protein
VAVQLSLNFLRAQPTLSVFKNPHLLRFAHYHIPILSPQFRVLSPPPYYQNLKITEGISRNLMLATLHPTDQYSPTPTCVSLSTLAKNDWIAGLRGVKRGGTVDSPDSRPGDGVHKFRPLNMTKEAPFNTARSRQLRGPILRRSQTMEAFASTWDIRSR